MLVLLHAETDDLVLDGLLGGHQGVDLRQEHREFNQVLAGAGVVQLLAEGA